MIIQDNLIVDFQKFLIADEKSGNTVSKYVHDILLLEKFADGRELSKPLLLEFKEWLSNHYKLTSANSVIAATNKFLQFIGLEILHVKQFKLQKEAYLSENRELTKEEYVRLVRAASVRRDDAIALIMETIAATGIRVSELRFVTVESLASAEFTVTLKRKTRKVMLVSSLCRKLRRYCTLHKISHGSIFKINRSEIWKKMKSLCAEASVLPTKVFPHNLRHLFARSFYEIEKDVVKLADVLGHSDINTTHIYLLTSGREHRKLLEKMEMVLSG